jgi:kumamolisin
MLHLIGTSALAHFSGRCLTVVRQRHQGDDMNRYLNATLSSLIVVSLAGPALTGLDRTSVAGNAHLESDQSVQPALVRPSVGAVQDPFRETQIQPDPNAVVDGVIGLAVRHEKDLEELIARQSDPQSPDFRNFLSTDAFAARFAPKKNDVEKLVTFLESKNLKVVSVSSNRLIVQVRGASADLKEVFGDDASEPAAKAIPPELQDLVRSVSSSSVHSTVSPMSRKQLVTALPDGWSPRAIGSVYNFPNANNSRSRSRLTGSGVTVAVLGAGRYNRSDLESYWSRFGIKRTGTLTDVHVGADGSTLEDEDTLDLEQLGAQAPGADILMYLAPDRDTSDFLLMYNQVVVENKAAIVSISWTWPEIVMSQNGDLAVLHSLLAEGVAQGMSFFAATGDAGAYELPLDFGLRSVCYPASDPFVTAVGGTSLTERADGLRGSETAWTGSGGGISLHFRRPAWQAGVGLPSDGKRSPLSILSGSADNRRLPDVSMVADSQPGYAVYFDGAWITEGGTSFATPNWAALWALAEEACHQRFGLPNGPIYRLCQSTAYHGTFFDVVAGNNGHGRGPGFKAGTGFDCATGWGCPDGDALIQWLKSDRPQRADL